MRVFDFDGTIYKGDSGRDFILFSLKKHFFKVFPSLFKGFFLAILEKLNIVSIAKLKSVLFSFSKKIPDFEKHVDEFAKSHKDNLMDWYKEIRKEDDLILSASLDIYLNRLLEELDIKNYISTKYDIKNSKIIGKNVRSKEKVNKLYEKFGEDLKVKEAYGNSKHDKYLLEIAEKSYLVINEKPIKYDNRYK